MHPCPSCLEALKDTITVHTAEYHISALVQTQEEKHPEIERHSQEKLIHYLKDAIKPEHITFYHENLEDGTLVLRAELLTLKI